MEQADVCFGADLHDALEAAGIIPPNTGDLIIEVPCSGLAIIHEIRLAPGKLLEVVRASVSPAKIRLEP